MKPILPAALAALLVCSIAQPQPVSAQQTVDLRQKSGKTALNRWMQIWFEDISLDRMSTIKRRPAGVMNCDGCYFESWEGVTELLPKNVKFCMRDSQLHVSMSGRTEGGSRQYLMQNGRRITATGGLRKLVWEDRGWDDWQVVIPVQIRQNQGSARLTLESDRLRTWGVDSDEFRRAVSRARPIDVRHVAGVGLVTDNMTVYSRCR